MTQTAKDCGPAAQEVGGAPGIYALEDPNVTLRIQVKCRFRLRWRIQRQHPNSGCAGGSVGRIQIQLGASVEEPPRIRSVRWKIHKREDDQEDGLVELREELMDTDDPYAGVDPRQAQLETELDDVSESSGERSGADEGSSERSRRARARGHSCGRRSTSEFTRRMRQSYPSPSLPLSLSGARGSILTRHSHRDANLSISRAPPGSSGAGPSGRGASSAQPPIEKAEPPPCGQRRSSQ
jgi:hypothetical protein